MAKRIKRYEAFADRVAEQIRRGILAPGERVPSVRQASRSQGVSASTVFRAYYLLEDRGLIEARARSGYFVRERARRLLEEPTPGPRGGMGAEVAVSELVFSVLASLQDSDTVPFGSAFPDPALFPLARLARSMSRGLRERPDAAVIGDMTAGHDALRRQILQRYALAGVSLLPDELVITNGAMEGLNLALQSVTRPGDLVAIESPAFYASLQVLERLGLKAVEIPVHPRHGIDLAILAERLAGLPIKACWLMSHLQNPLGASLSDAHKAELYRLLERYEVPLLEDDAYAELHFDTRPPRPVKAFDRAGLVMHCGSFSKCLAPGYRIGWVAGGRWAEEIARCRLMTTISPSLPAQWAIADYLQHGGFDRHLRRLRHALESQQRAMLAAADRYFPSGTRVSRPTGGYFLWCEFPGRVDALRLMKQALAEGISLAPGPIFSASRGFRHCVRLSYGHSWSPRSEAAMRRLGELLDAF